MAEGLGESAGVNHGEATLGGLGSYENIEAINYVLVTECPISKAMNG
jgi:hypothetical protein